MVATLQAVHDADAEEQVAGILSFLVSQLALLAAPLEIGRRQRRVVEHVGSIATQLGGSQGIEQTEPHLPIDLPATPWVFHRFAHAVADFQKPLHPGQRLERVGGAGRDGECSAAELQFQRLLDRLLCLALGDDGFATGHPLGNHPALLLPCALGNGLSRAEVGIEHDFPGGLLNRWRTLGKQCRRPTDGFREVFHGLLIIGSGAGEFNAAEEPFDLCRHQGRTVGAGFH